MTDKNVANLDSLTQVMDMIMPRVRHGVYNPIDVAESRRKVRLTLSYSADMRLPLYVVVVGSGHGCVVSDYAPAMFMANMTEGNVTVWAVYRDSGRVWHVSRQ